MRVLILGGTGEARALAASCAGRPDLDVVTSLAGLTDGPRRPPGEVRTGGFGGPDGLAAALRDGRFGAVVDATHPFAVRISVAAAAAAGASGVPLLVLRRPGWAAEPGDDWRRVGSLADAAALLPALGERVFLTTGRRGIAPFAHLDRCWFLARTVQPPAPPLPARLQVLLARGPFDPDDERTLLDRHRIDVLVSRDSGGGATAAKLVAARDRRIPVILVDRPPPSAGLSTVDTAAAALDWLSAVRCGAAGTCP